MISSRLLGGVVDCVSVNPSVRARLNHGLRDAQNVCALKIVGTVLNTHKQRTDKLCLIDVANELAALTDNRKNNFGTFKESDLKMSG